MTNKIKAKKILYLDSPWKINYSIDGDGAASLSEVMHEDIEFLREQGFNVDIVRTASDAYGSLHLNEYDLFVMRPECQQGTLKKQKQDKLVGQTLLSILEEESNNTPVILSSLITDFHQTRYLDSKPNVIARLTRPYRSEDLLKYVELKTD
ncbi:hypothetical protein HOK51_05410 [Candidatus Woesearchaeota archaeon]|jgi:hypothetical protein|nr:hypothetical protein [Candidatus Woesearchaeota archaeon]MBT6519265.1 hypothetical protein [Candidatus Woesearchaeota archaeon]MBT7368457.1 hypothetical protein [Candidatus Woesearchaeota archaeon]